MKRYQPTIYLGVLLVLIGCHNQRNSLELERDQSMPYQIRQLTSEQRNHFISAYGGFSPDDRWLVFDTRSDEPAMGSNADIAKVHTQTGEIKNVYHVPNQNPHGPGCGTPSYHPHDNKVIFIHGIKNADASRPYDLHRRTCVMVDDNQPGNAIHLDARDVTPPFTPGALRGGTHAHQFSGDGDWIGFTYNDALLAAIEQNTGRPVNLRTIGVMTGSQPVPVVKDAESENNDGLWFAVLAARVTPEPTPGSDEISRAFSNAWIGEKGYRKPDGQWQRAQAYLGKLKAKNGDDLVEVFLSDIPETIDRPGPHGPLAGTAESFPMPPAGVEQRRLTHTENRIYPGVATDPRHWLLSSSDGKYIAFLARDESGIIQIYGVSPLGGEPVPLTKNASSIQNTFFWKPDSHLLVYVCDNSLFAGGLIDGKIIDPIRLTGRFDQRPIHPCWSHDGKMIAFNLDVAANGQTHRQLFIVEISGKI